MMIKDSVLSNTSPVVQMVERGDPNLCVVGSSPIRVAKFFVPFVAQLVEQGTENPRVIGSIPIGGTILCGRSSSGRAPPCQGGGSEFEPRRPLQMEWKYSLQIW